MRPTKESEQLFRKHFEEAMARGDCFLIVSAAADKSPTDLVLSVFGPTEFEKDVGAFLFSRVMQKKPELLLNAIKNGGGFKKVMGAAEEFLKSGKPFDPRPTLELTGEQALKLAKHGGHS